MTESLNQMLATLPNRTPDQLNTMRERAVRHPYVEVGIDKDGVRAIARRLEARTVVAEIVDVRA